MPVKRLLQYLDENEIRYKIVQHPPTFTAQETAQVTHVKGQEMAKTVVLKIEGLLSMVVLPATHRVDLEHIREVIGADRVELADEAEFAQRFPGCEIGAMPPFGNLYDMGVFVHEDLAKDEQIAFNAGSHTEIIVMAYQDFEALVQPNVGAYAA